MVGFYLLAHPFLDYLFGKCVDVNFEGSTYKLAYEERGLLNKLRSDFLRVGLDFTNKYVQCVFRGLILKFRFFSFS